LNGEDVEAADFFKTNKINIYCPLDSAGKLYFKGKRHTGQFSHSNFHLSIHQKSFGSSANNYINNLVVETGHTDAKMAYQVYGEIPVFKVFEIKHKNQLNVKSFVEQNTFI